jgi:hypothetical protein
VSIGRKHGLNNSTQIHIKTDVVYSVSECNEYSKLATSQIAVLPLVPSPEPLHVDIPKCDFSSVPLIVGGEEAMLKEFPHMVITS